jgi:hypothetical protein
MNSTQMRIYRYCAVYSTNEHCTKYISYVRSTVCFAERQGILAYLAMKPWNPVFSRVPQPPVVGGMGCPLLDVWPTVLPCSDTADDDAVQAAGPRTVAPDTVSDSDVRSFVYVLFCLVGKTNGVVQVRRATESEL